MDDKANKTQAATMIQPINRNKAPVLAQHDNSKAMFRKMSNHTNKQPQPAQFHMPINQKKRTHISDPDNMKVVALSTVQTHSSAEERGDKSPKSKNLVNLRINKTN